MAKGELVFISGKKSLPVPVWYRDQIIRVFYRRSVGSTDRAQNVVLIMNKGIDIQ